MTILYKNFLRSNENYKLTDSDLIDLFSFLGQHYPISEIKIKKEDGTEQVLFDIQDISKVENYKPKRITSMYSYCYKFETNSSNKSLCELMINLENVSNPFSYTVNISYSFLDDSLGLRIQNYLDVFFRMRIRKKSYSFIFKNHNLISKLYFGITIGLSSSLLLYPKIVLEYLGELTIIISTMITLVIGLLLLMKTKIIDSLFPTVVFYFGNEIDEEQRRSNLRRELFWGVIIAFAISIITKYV